MIDGTGILPLHYMPSISIFRSMSRFRSLDFQLDRPFEKMSFRNRCVITDAQGMHTLSVPIRGGRGFRGAYHDVMIDDRQPWNIHHWRAICTAYGRAPWFEFLAPGLESLYSSPPERLTAWNVQCLHFLFRQTGLPMPDLVEATMDDPTAETSVDDRKEAWPRPQDFQFPRFGPFPAYVQVFQEKIPFSPNLSMLDFVLCAGPRMVRDWMTGHEKD